MHLISKIIKYGTLPLFLIIMAYLALVNFNNKDFMKMDLNDVLTLCLLFFVSYFLVERKNDRRILNEKIEQTCSIINDELTKIDKSLFCEDFEVKQYTVISKRISNKINLLKNYMRKLDIKKEVEYIENSFKEIDGMISNHINNISELDMILVDINNKKDQIDVRIDSIFTKLY